MLTQYCPYLKSFTTIHLSCAFYKCSSYIHMSKRPPGLCTVLSLEFAAAVKFHHQHMQVNCVCNRVEDHAGHSHCLQGALSAQQLPADRARLRWPRKPAHTRLSRL